MKTQWDLPALAVYDSMYGRKRNSDAVGWGEAWEFPQKFGVWGVISNGYSFFWQHENVLNKMVVITAHFCDYARNDWIVCFNK